LKLAGIDVSVLGRYDLEASVHRYLTRDAARSLVMEQGKLVGATIVGHCEDSSYLARAIDDNLALSGQQLSRFKRTGKLGLSKTQLPVACWPLEALVCQCARVTRGALSDLLAQPACDMAQLQTSSRAGTICGSCLPLVSNLMGTASAAPRTPYSRLTGLASALLFVCVLLFMLVPSLPVSASVRHARFAFETLWRSSTFRQTTGFIVVGSFTIGLLLSARKRLRWLTWGSFGGYRALHTCLGLLSVAALCVHTGLHLGAHLNFALMTVFVASALVGGLAGIAAALESSSAAAWARGARGALSRAHVWLLWPLPALLAFHILAVYYF
jgi:nitrite reductase (NADH) large subunit